ncbi:right-handed parallel beta-helix repeat-containing protein [Streptomyces sp. NPDC089795]|uniref:right-handed parallel beta-helix repeat-containing protein n=1 Tax=Streptomyces sp. NPDC089795 TaxID=3155297 RepID=UPI003434692C
MRKLYALLPAVAVVATAFPATPSYAASTLVVSAAGVTAHCPNATYSTIGAAVAAAVAGDTVHVCPGIYNEIVEVNKANLILEGESTLPANCDQFAAPDPAVDSVIEATSPSGEGIVNLREDGIRFQGFTVQNNQGSTLGGYGINTVVGHSGYLITGNVIQGNPAGMYYNTSGATQSQVTRNCIRLNNTGFQSQPAAGNGIYSDQGLDNALIDNNAFFQNRNGAITLDKFQNVVRVNIHHNVSHQDDALLNIFRSNDSVVADNQAVGNTGAAVFVGDDNHNLQILRNTLQNSYDGIRTQTFSTAGSDQVTIAGNTVQNATHDGISAGPNSLTASTVSDNTVTGSGRDGVLIENNGGNNGNTVTRNLLQSSVRYDCEDLTTGTGTAGTANTWTDNRATTSNPAALCPAKPTLTIGKTHQGDFTGGTKGRYTITVGNAGPGATDGSTVTVHDVLPQGLSAVGLSGTGWACSVATLTCTRSDVLAAGARYPVITLTVRVPCPRTTQHGIDTVTVTGGGDTATHTATDPTTIKRGKQCEKHTPHKPHKPGKQHKPHKPGHHHPANAH